MAVSLLKWFITVDRLDIGIRGKEQTGDAYIHSNIQNDKRLADYKVIDMVCKDLFYRSNIPNIFDKEFNTANFENNVASGFDAERYAKARLQSKQPIQRFDEEILFTLF